MAMRPMLLVPIIPIVVQPVTTLVLSYRDDRLSHNSLMSYHYSASKLRGNAAQHYHCDNTPQTLMYAMDDWETIQTLYEPKCPAISQA